MEQDSKNRTKTELTGKEKRMRNLKRDAGPGRPKGVRDFITIYKEAIKMLAKENNETPEEFENKMIAKGIVMGRKGQYQFYKDTLDRLHGQATQKQEITGKDGKDLIPDKVLKSKIDEAINQFIDGYTKNTNKQ